MDERSKKVLICPLDWGLGHATRCVPVIRIFLEAGYEVVIAADGRPYDFLKDEFPSLKIIRFPGTKIRYNKTSDLAMAIARQLPSMISGHFSERRFLKKIIAEEKPGIIFSDNRYGVRDKNCFNIILTHQLELQIPEKISFLKPVINLFLRKTLKKFNEIWVPDYQNHFGIAGKLSHPANHSAPVSYVGTLSRFSHIPTFPEHGPLLFDLVVILSGPEPQRTIIEEIIFAQLKDTGLRAIIVQGLTEKKAAFNLTPAIRVYSHLDTISLHECMMQAEIVICRSGYSGIMDLVTLGKKAILIPTPGQTEQEYLARYLMDKKIFFSISQEKFDLLYAIEMSRNFPGMLLRNDLKALKEKIISLSEPVQDVSLPVQ